MNEEQLKAMKENCPFCKIARGEIEAYTVYQDDMCMAILDINPVTDGHLLLFPKEHYMLMPLVPDEVLSHMFTVQKNLITVLKASLDAQDVNVMITNGHAAGQQIMHFAIQLIPNYGNENITIKNDQPVDEATMKEIKSALAEGLKSFQQA